MVYLYEYTNPEYYPKINDFGDDYHKDESELTTSYDRELMNKLRSMKRKYRDFDEYCQAKRIYNDYGKWLIEKYGGKKRLKFFHQLGLVKEYIPFCPELRKIKKNRSYVKGGLPLIHDLEMDLPKPEQYSSEVTVKIKFSEIEMKHKDIREMYFKEDIRDSISSDLTLIGEFYKHRAPRPTRLDHKSVRKQLLQERYHNQDDIPFKKKIKKYNKRRYKLDFVETHIDPNAYTIYKDVSLNLTEVRKIETYEWLKGLGVRVSRKALGKAGRQVVRRSIKFNKKGKKKKGKSIMRSKYMKDFKQKRYDSFKDFERDLLDVTEKKMREGYDFD